eukprot:2091074-Ditylum_brightwellii.AAC.2
MSGLLLNPMGQGFLLIILFNSLKPVMNLIVLSFVGITKVGAPHSDFNVSTRVRSSFQLDELWECECIQTPIHHSLSKVEVFEEDTRQKMLHVPVPVPSPQVVANIMGSVGQLTVQALFCKYSIHKAISSIVVVVR